MKPRLEKKEKINHVWKGRIVGLIAGGVFGFFYAFFPLEPFTVKLALLFYKITNCNGFGCIVPHYLTYIILFAIVGLLLGGYLGEKIKHK